MCIRSPTLVCLVAAGLLFPAAASAQPVAITEIRVPRQHSEEFVELYHEMVNAMETVEEGVKPVSRNLLAHAWAGDVSFLQLTTYETVDDLNAGLNGDPAKIRAHMETLPEGEREAFRERWQRFLSLYLEGHTDEARVTVPDWGFNYDPTGHETHAHIVTRSEYSPSYANANEFLETWGELNIPEDAADSDALMIVAGRHLSGSGPTVDIWTVYESWKDFADFMSAPGPSPDQEAVARMLEIEGEHRDGIYVRVGGYYRAEDGTARFELTQN